MKLIKNILLLSLILFSTTSFVAIAQDDTTTAQNGAKQTQTTNPLESLYDQYKEFGKVTVDSENLEATITLLKESIVQLEQQKSSLSNASAYRIRKNISAGILTTYILIIGGTILHFKYQAKKEKKSFWQLYKEEIIIDIPKRAINMDPFGIMDIATNLLGISAPFALHYFSKKIQQSTNLLQEIESKLTLNKDILSQLTNNQT